jgi:hypothetical protein
MKIQSTACAQCTDDRRDPFVGETKSRIPKLGKIWGSVHGLWGGIIALIVVVVVVVVVVTKACGGADWHAYLPADGSLEVKRGKGIMHGGAGSLAVGDKRRRPIMEYSSLAKVSGIGCCPE